MSKLVSANFSRLFRNKFFWICFALVIGAAAFIAISFRVNYPWCTKQFGHQTASILFKYMAVLAGIAALFVSLFIGEEYSNKTIRNKIASGYSKTKIYGANWLVCVVAGILFYVAFFLIIALPIAPWAPLMKYNGYIIARILKRAVVNLFAISAIVSIAVFIAMIVKNRIAGVVAIVVCMLALFVAAELMYEGISEPKLIEVTDAETGKIVNLENPDYENSVKRGVFQVIMDTQPFGQILQVKMQRIGGTADGIKPILLPVYSCLVSLFFSFGGAYLFGKRDLE